MMNVDQITTRLSMMDDAALQKFAAMNKNDPYLLPLAISESNRRKRVRSAAQAQQAQPQPPVADAAVAQMQPAPEQAMPQMAAGIPQLAARNIEGMADGGIAGYAKGGAPQAERDKYRAYAMRKAKELGLDPKFVDAIFQTESGYDPNAKSKTGPVGIGQLAKQTARAKGLKPEERKDPYKNMDASLSLMQDFFKKYRDPAKVAVAYNQGEGVLNSHLKKNKGQLVPEKLHEDVRTSNKQEPFNYLKKLNNYIPLPVVAAADVVPRGEFKPTEIKKPTPVAQPEPKRAAPAPAAQAPQKPTYLSPLGIPEAALSLGTGAISPLTGTLYAGGRALMGDPVTSQEEAFGDVTFAPRSEAGKDVTSFMHQTLVDKLKVPPFTPGLGPVRVRPKAGKAITQAEAAAAEAATAAEAAKTAELPRLEGPKPATAPSRALDVRQRFAEAQERAAQAAEAAGDMEKAAALRAGVAQSRQFTPDPAAQKLGIEAVLARKRAGQAADIRKAQEAAAAAERSAAEAQLLAERERGIDNRATALADVRNRGAARTNVLSPAVIGSEAGVRASEPTAAAPVPEGGPQRTGGFDYRPYGGEEVAPPPPAAEDKAPAPTAEQKKAFGLDNEDLLMLGLGMLASPGGQAGNDLSQLFSNFGRAGMGAVAAKREREKLAQEKSYKDVMEKYYGKLTEMYGRPELIERQIAEIRKANPGMGYEEAMERVYAAQYGSRMETQLEAARLRNPFAALMGDNMMEPGTGSLTPRGQEIFRKYYPG